jgi:hypothetical protein
LLRVVYVLMSRSVVLWMTAFHTMTTLRGQSDGVAFTVLCRDIPCIDSVFLRSLYTMRPAVPSVCRRCTLCWLCDTSSMLRYPPVSVLVVDGIYVGCGCVKQALVSPMYREVQVIASQTGLWLVFFSWSAHGEHVEPGRMRLLSFVVGTNRSKTIKSVYVESTAKCFRAVSMRACLFMKRSR